MPENNYTMQLSVLIKNILFTVLIPGSVGVYVPRWLGAQYAGQADWWSLLAWPLLLFGAGILLLCIFDFMHKGEGTPFPLDPPKNLVTGRLYRRTRNPMYVGVLAMIAGWALWFSSATLAGYWLAVALVFNLFILIVEEPSLKKQFGEQYAEYCRQAPRWL